MPFNTALSGIRAASNDLNITGNNIANASTTGFKSSRAEFGDVYASSILGAGSNPIGSGVRLQDVAQNFKDGNIAFTENELDLAVKGSGFFVVQKGGEQFYTRAGLFSLDKDENLKIIGLSSSDRFMFTLVEGKIDLDLININYKYNDKEISADYKLNQK